MAVGKFNESIYMQDNPDEDQQLLQRLAAGDIRAFWPLWQKYQDYLFCCCLRWKNGNETEAEDLLSQAMLKAREKVQNYAGKIANFKSWVTALVRNFWLDMQRRPCAKQVEDIEVYAEREEVGLVSVDDTPASALEREDKKMVIRRAIDELSATMRETFMLHFYEELSHQEIAERQKVPYQNVSKRISQARAILAKKLRGYFIGEDGTKPDTAKVAAKPAKSKKAAQKAAQVEPILPETVILSEQLEGDEELSHQEMGNRQEIFCQNVGERFCEVPAILEGEDGTIMELAVMPVGREQAIEEMSQGNGELSPDVGAKHIAFGMASLTGEESMTQNQRFAIRRRSLLEEYASPSHWERLNRDAPVGPVVGVPVTKSVAVAEVESVAGQELPVVAVSVGDSESDSVVGSSGGRLSEFNFIGKPVVGAFSRWLHCFGGSQLFYGIREVGGEGEWCRWVELCERVPVVWGRKWVPVVWGDNGCRWGTLRENLCESRDILVCIVFSIKINNKFLLNRFISRTIKEYRPRERVIALINQPKLLLTSEPGEPPWPGWKGPLLQRGGHVCSKPPFLRGVWGYLDA